MKASDLTATSTSSTSTNKFAGLYPPTSYDNGVTTITGLVEGFHIESFELQENNDKKSINIKFSKANSETEAMSYYLSVYDFFQGNAEKLEMRARINVSNLLNLFQSFGVPKEAFADLDVDTEGTREGIKSLVEDIQSIVKFPLIPTSPVKLKVVFKDKEGVKSKYKVSGNFPITESAEFNTGKVTFKTGEYGDNIVFTKLTPATDGLDMNTSNTFNDLATSFSVPDSDMPF